MRLRSEVALSVALYVAALLFSILSNVWLNAWGRQLSLISTFFHLHPISAEADASSPSPSPPPPSPPSRVASLNPFDLAALESSIAAAVAHGGGGANGDALLSMCDSRVNTAPVFDLGLHFFPHLGWRWLPDAFVFTMLPALLIAVFWPEPASAPLRFSLPPPSQAVAGVRSAEQGDGATPRDEPVRDSAAAALRPSPVRAYWPSTLVRLCCVLQCHALILLMRSSTTLATVHRASPVCHSQSLEFAANPGFVLNTSATDQPHRRTAALTCATFALCSSAAHLFTDRGVFCGVRVRCGGCASAAASI